ncbi:hypothetical protein C7974DRAFT_376839 [Boeremia exigua]|uniref:uncharacterized protein n=1 Tax=Boeremia exigua TaxID=749465 RepID=UPI001E8DD436|nr:uncharacterized protein C7974DRAFT_376839 [Boeremia exigua]KAH6625301.1 hypothetical protein C7974DRAFT_376839 [Boeremia exigua]
MDLEQRTSGVCLGFTAPLSPHASTYLVRKHGKITFAPEHRLACNEEDKLGHIVLVPGGAKLQAIQTLYVLPSNSLATDRYQLEPASDLRVEILLLRHGDTITSPDATDSVTCVSRASEVQVNSSAAEHAKDDKSGKLVSAEDALEDETEDEVASNGTVTEVPVTQTITQPSYLQPSATPHLPRDKSDVVQETPTTIRMASVERYQSVPSNEDQHISAMRTIPIVATETFSTARTGYSPKSVQQDSVDGESTTGGQRPQGSPEVRINAPRTRKRTGTNPSPGLEDEHSTGDRPVKRAKKAPTAGKHGDGIDHASPLTSATVDPDNATHSTKGKGRSKVNSEATPTKSSRSSQRSGTATTAIAYEGDLPRVATSNSAIKEGSTALKFLRKHGGTFLTTVGERCNILCVRDGGLAKTMKVFQAIALGIPIVTDKWLTDSAKAESFLDLSSYKPAVVQQEKEWGFSLEKVWGTAQTPFKGYCIYFTPALKKTYTNFREMERVCQTVGAEVTAKRPSKNKNNIVLAMEEDDPDAERMIQDGEACYHKDLVTTSILRGRIDLGGDEFRIKAKHAGPTRKKGPRKTA